MNTPLRIGLLGVSIQSLSKKVTAEPFLPGLSPDALRGVFALEEAILSGQESSESLPWQDRASPGLSLCHELSTLSIKVHDENVDSR